MTGAAEGELAVGLQLLSKGELQSAAAAFENVLRSVPTQPDALHYLGIIAFQAGQNDKAIALIEASLNAHPHNPDAESNLGSVLMALGETEKAARALNRAIAMDDRPAAYHFNLGNAYAALKRMLDAVSAYQAAIDRQPDYPEALSNLGTVYRDLENLDAATICYEKALQVRPNYGEATYNLANAYRDAGRLSEAEKVMRLAITLNPQNAKAHNSLGNILSESAQSDLALSEFQIASSLDPASLAMASNVLSCMQYIVGVDPAQLEKAHTNWVQSFSHLFPAQPRTQKKSTSHAPLTVGFVSADFGQHPCGVLSVRLFENLDHHHIKPIIFSTRHHGREDDVSHRIAAVTDWRRMETFTDENLATAIGETNVDILIDMSGHTSGHRLGVFARKPAPIQMSWLGYVGSTGLPTMDYIIADRWHAPSGQHTSGPEQFLRLKDGYICFDPPAAASSVAPLPALRNGYVTFGSLNNATKLNAQVFDSYAIILQQVENSKLILRFRGLDDPVVAASIRNQFQARGVDSARIDIRGYAKQQEFLATYNEIDIALDTLPYSGGLTTCEALWMGVPVVTFPGQTFAGRHATSHMSNAGLADFVAHDRADFERLSVEKASHLQYLAQLRSEMRARLTASPLCDGPRFAASFAEAIRKTTAKHSAELGNGRDQSINLR